MHGDRYRRNVIGICTVTERNTPMTTTSLNAPVATRVPGVLRPAGLAVLLSAILSVVLIARNTDDGPVWRVGLGLDRAGARDSRRTLAGSVLARAAARLRSRRAGTRA